MLEPVFQRTRKGFDLTSIQVLSTYWQRMNEPLNEKINFLRMNVKSSGKQG